jgi:hypothetical protein
MSANPFSDMYATAESSDLPPPYEEHEYDGKIASFPESILVPFLDTLSPIHSLESESGGSSPSTAATFSLSTRFYDKIEWTNSDLNYLVHILYPEHIGTDSLFFVPELSSLDKVTGPVRLELCEVTPVPIPAYSPDAPIGTGRPTRVNVAASDHSTSPTLARRSLVKNLLQHEDVRLHNITTYYNLLGAIYGMDSPGLDSVQRGMTAMAHVSDFEWYERLVQVTDAGVDGSWGVEARLEAFLLICGREELDRWFVMVAIALRVVEKKREHFARMYREAAWFLEGVVRAFEGGGWREG